MVRMAKLIKRVERCAMVVHFRYGSRLLFLLLRFP
jgi:hypothetical protein